MTGPTEVADDGSIIAVLVLDEGGMKDEVESGHMQDLMRLWLAPNLRCPAPSISSTGILAVRHRLAVVPPTELVDPQHDASDASGDDGASRLKEDGEELPLLSIMSNCHSTLCTRHWEHVSLQVLS